MQQGSNSPDYKLLTGGITAIQVLKNQIVVIAEHLELMENFSTCHTIMVS